MEGQEGQVEGQDNETEQQRAGSGGASVVPLYLTLRQRVGASTQPVQQRGRRRGVAECEGNQRA